MDYYRQIVKDFVSSRWTDEKIAHVYAFNEDGKMSFMNPCACLVGVDSSSVLHRFCWSPSHYCVARRNPVVLKAEHAFMMLGDCHRKERRRIFGEILREIMAEREALRHCQMYTSISEAVPC